MTWQAHRKSKNEKRKTKHRNDFRDVHSNPEIADAAMDDEWNCNNVRAETRSPKKNLIELRRVSPVFDQIANMFDSLIKFIIFFVL